MLKLNKSPARVLLYEEHPDDPSSKMSGPLLIPLEQAIAEKASDTSIIKNIKLRQTFQNVKWCLALIINRCPFHFSQVQNVVFDNKLITKTHCITLLLLVLMFKIYTDKQGRISGLSITVFSSLRSIYADMLSLIIRN